jgi:hypothetical protein
MLYSKGFMGYQLIDGYLLVGPLEEPREISLRTPKRIGACLLSLKDPLKGHSFKPIEVYIIKAAVSA